MKREDKRNKLANDVCREVRYQIVKYGWIKETDELYKHFEKWFMIAKKDKYKRP